MTLLTTAPSPTDEDAVAADSNIYDERFGLFGLPSQRSRLTAIYGDGPHAGQPQVSGFNASGAWKLERGRPDAVIAILDTGIKWDRGDLRTQIHLNTGELPVPNHARATPVSDASTVPGGSCSNMASAYDANGDGAFNVLDYVCDSRVAANAGTHGNPSLLDAEDLIAAFADGSDADSQRLRRRHRRLGLLRQRQRSLRRLELLRRRQPRLRPRRERSRAGQRRRRGIGVCPHCQIMPIRTWDTFVSDGNTFAMGILYGDRQRRRGDRGRQRQHLPLRLRRGRPPSTPMTTASSRPSPATTSTPATTTTRPTTATRC